ncbi:MAG: 3-oxoacyl-[acyl-carrier-protein] synthase-1 [Alphaproteobacteria bacterium]|jgi:3-oxoacyl-[acyl-carrier-protein] synthase-1
MKRAVITGIGIVSSIGNNKDEVAQNLKNGFSGISTSSMMQEHQFKSQVEGKPTLNLDEAVDRRARRFMGDGAAWNYAAMKQAITDSGLDDTLVSHPETGLVMGSGGPSTKTLFKAAQITEKSGPRKIGPFAVPACMSSTNSATLSVPFKIKGVNYSISSACATSVHCIGHASELIALGKQNIVFAGGGEELDWTLSCLFDAMGAMSSKYNDTPQQSSRAYDANRDGFVIAGGAGVVVVEEYEHAKARGAHIYAEITGYGATSDGNDMVQPSGEGAARCMQQALKNFNGTVDYLNPHATSTPVGDKKEAEALRTVFGSSIPNLSATKSMTGHSLGAAGVHEVIYSLLMMRDNFIAPSINIDTIDPDFIDLPIIQKTQEAKINHILSNSFGFGGTNGSILLSKI